MTFAAEVEEQVRLLARLLGDEVCSDQLPAAIEQAEDEDVVAVVRATTALIGCAERARVAAIGVIAARSAREAGQAGLAQSRGHRSVSSFIQHLTGASRADATQQVRVGESLFEKLRPDSAGSASGGGGAPDENGADALFGGTHADDTPGGSADASGDASGGEGTHGTDGDGDGESGGGAGAAPGGGGGAEPGASGADRPGPKPWHEPLRVALLAGRITSVQHDAIRRNLGEPPDPASDDTDPTAAVAANREAWAVAAEQLITEAARVPIEQLRAAARGVRDHLDPEGARRRFLERYERRSFRLWTDVDGIRRGSFAFDDEGGTWVESILAAALRPRRGGPRFVDSEEQARALSLVEDTRSNDQLAYDLILDVLRAGALADAPTVFGTRQAGVRLVRVVNTDGTVGPVAHTEDGLHTLPGAAADQHICDSGVVPVTVDSCGNPLDVGREQRLFTPRQRIALAIRDGGCRWPGCDRPASYCEAHHADEWVADRGRTDIDRGILLCRFHHMNLHHHGWRITRNGKDDFALQPPGGAAAIPLRPPLQLTYAWAGIDPPPKRFHPAA